MQLTIVKVVVPLGRRGAVLLVRVLAHVVREVVAFVRVGVVVLEREVLVLVGFGLVGQGQGQRRRRGRLEVPVRLRLRLGLRVPHQGLVRRVRRGRRLRRRRRGALRAGGLSPRRLPAVAGLVPVILVFRRLRLLLALLPAKRKRELKWSTGELTKNIK